MLNIHPVAAAGVHGLDTHARALAAGVKHARRAPCISSSPEMDAGPIIAQAAVPVLPDDSEDDARRARARG